VTVTLVLEIAAGILLAYFIIADFGLALIWGCLIAAVLGIWYIGIPLIVVHWDTLKIAVGAILLLAFAGGIVSSVWEQVEEYRFKRSLKKEAMADKNYTGISEG
jgi:hypothetical protein